MHVWHQVALALLTGHQSREDRREERAHLARQTQEAIASTRRLLQLTKSS
jgi:hypothetical protein